MRASTSPYPPLLLQTKEKREEGEAHVLLSDTSVTSGTKRAVLTAGPYVPTWYPNVQPRQATRI